MKNFKNLLFVAVLFISASVLGQAKITGEVVDETNQPLPGASIVVKGTTNGTSTDFDGKFEYSNTISIDNRIDASFKEIIGKTNLLGQDVDECYNGIVIVRYKDGTSQKFYQFK